MKLTKELLEKNNTCVDAIEWCERNRLFGFPLEQLDQIKGDFNGYVAWLKSRTFDSRGNMIRSFGREFPSLTSDTSHCVKQIDSVLKNND